MTKLARYRLIWCSAGCVMMALVFAISERALCAPDAEGAGSAELTLSASVVVLSDRESVVTDSSCRFHIRKEIVCKALDQRGADSLQRQVIRFDAAADTVIVEAARTGLPDGTWHDADVNGFQAPVTPEVRNAPAYSRFSRLQIVFPGMKSGSLAQLVYRIEPKLQKGRPFVPRKGGVVLFGGYVRMVDKQFIIKCPANQRIYCAMQNSDAKPVLSEENGYRIYAWTFHDCPQINPEPYSVGLASLVPRLLWTTFPDWENLGTYAGDLFWEKVDSSRSAVDGYLQITSSDLRGTPALMNAALWTSGSLRTVDLPLDATGYVPHSADWVWQNRCGTSLDKCIFLTAIIRAYGFNPVPVLVPFENVPFSQLPVLEQFKHVILAVPGTQDTLWLDPAAEFYPPGDLPHACTYGMGCMLVAGAPLITKVAPVGESEATRTEIRASLDSVGNLSGWVECNPRGGQAARARQVFGSMGNGARSAYSARVVRQIGLTATVQEFALSNVADVVAPATVRVKFNCTGFATPVSGGMAMSIPDSPFDFADCDFDTTAEVSYPVEFRCHGSVVSECGITLPLGYRLASLPPPLIIENRYVHLELSGRLLPNGFEWTKTIEIKADHVPVADYPVVRAGFQAVESPQNRRLVIAPVRSPKSNPHKTPGRQR